jgi:hypothetical protein
MPKKKMIIDTLRGLHPKQDVLYTALMSKRKLTEIPVIRKFYKEYVNYLGEEGTNNPVNTAKVNVDRALKQLGQLDQLKGVEQTQETWYKALDKEFLGTVKYKAPKKAKT